MIKGLFEKKTKWIPLTSYNDQGRDWIVFARRGLKTGMIYFKSKLVTPLTSNSYIFNGKLLEIEKQFEFVLGLNDTKQHVDEPTLDVATSDMNVFCDSLRSETGAISVSAWIDRVEDIELMSGGLRPRFNIMVKMPDGKEFTSKSTGSFKDAKYKLLQLANF